MYHVTTPGENGVAAGSEPNLVATLRLYTNSTLTVPTTVMLRFVFRVTNRQSPARRLSRELLPPLPAPSFVLPVLPVFALLSLLCMQQPSVVALASPF